MKLWKLSFEKNSSGGDKKIQIMALKNIYAIVQRNFFLDGSFINEEKFSTEESILKVILECGKNLHPDKENFVRFTEKLEKSLKNVKISLEGSEELPVIKVFDYVKMDIL